MALQRKDQPIYDLADIVSGKAILGMDAKVDGMVCASIEHPPVVGATRSQWTTRRRASGSGLRASGFGTNPADRASKQVAMDIIHVCGTPEGAARGMQLAIVALVLAGAPLAVLGIVLSTVSTRNDLQWTSGWKSVFQTGFVVQLSSVGVTAPVAALFVTSVLLDDGWDLLAGVFCFVSAAAGGVALPAWRRLIGASAPDTPLSIR